MGKGEDRHVLEAVVYDCRCGCGFTYMDLWSDGTLLGDRLIRVPAEAYRRSAKVREAFQQMTDAIMEDVAAANGAECVGGTVSVKPHDLN